LKVIFLKGTFKVKFKKSGQSLNMIHMINFLSLEIYSTSFVWHLMLLNIEAREKMKSRRWMLNAKIFVYTSSPTWIIGQHFIWIENYADIISFHIVLFTLKEYIQLSQINLQMPLESIQNQAIEQEWGKIFCVEIYLMNVKFLVKMS